MTPRTETFSLKAIQQYHHKTLIQFDDQETLVEALTNTPGFSGANPVVFLSILARRPEIRLNDLDEAILTDKTLIRANVFRNSLFLINSADYPVYFRALYQLLKNSNLKKLADLGVTETAIVRMQHKLRECNFKENKEHAQIIEILYSPKNTLPSVDVQKLILRKLCELGTLARTYHKGWKGNDFSYALMDNWLPDIKLIAENQESARVQLIRRYISSFGPVSKEDILWWTGLNEAQVTRSLTNLKRELAPVAIEGYKDELFMLKEKLPLIKMAKNLGSHISFLPPWDPFTTGWHNRKRTIKRNHFNFAFDSLGNTTGTIVQQGQIIGLWQFRDSQEHIFEYHLFEGFRDLATSLRYLAEDYAKILARVSGSTSFRIYERDLPEPLNKRPAGAFLWPLGKELPFKTNNSDLFTSPLERRSPNKFRQPYLGNQPTA